MMAWLSSAQIALVVVVTHLASVALAGGSPETTLLVVNGDSPASLQVANTYIRLREIPERHVLWLHGVPAGHTIDVDAFRRHVLEPIRNHLSVSGLEREIDLIAYSAGFPYAVNFRKDEAAKGLKPDKLRGDAGSLTGMSFFASKVLAGQIDYLTVHANHYARRPVSAPVSVLSSRAGRSRDETVQSLAGLRLEGARGFRSRYLWGRGPGVGGMSDTDRYRLAVMLGYTGVRGNSVPEIEAYLARAAASDGTQPAGTVYLMKNRDIRSRTRQHLFESTIDALRARGRRAEVLAEGTPGQNGREPRAKGDVIGLVAGARGLDWTGSQSVFLPGAIAESLTSYAAHFDYVAQTKLSDFLRHGAAGSSGAVREPYALVEKFPLPQMHAHYADGVSLAEAFFLSVLSPYQLLVVGDPLARPFAQFADVLLPEWAGAAGPEGVVRGVLRFQPQVREAAGRAIDRLELWVDGLLLGSAAPGTELVLDTRTLADGVHDLRVVAVETGAIETRSYVRQALWVDNSGRSVTVTDLPPSVRWGETLALAGEARGARRVRIAHLGRYLAEVPVRDGRWWAEVAAARLGLGEATLSAVAEWADGPNARSVPLPVTVAPPPLLPPSAGPSVVVGGGAGARNGGRGDKVAANGAAGLSLRVEHVAQPAIETRVDGLSRPLAQDLRATKAARLVFVGAFEVKASGLYELDVEALGTLGLSVGGQVFEPFHVTDGPRKTRTARFVLPLAAGWHRVELEVTSPRANMVKATLAGPEVAFVLAKGRVATVDESATD